jgi:hypothetical protein
MLLDGLTSCDRGPQRREILVVGGFEFLGFVEIGLGRTRRRDSRSFVTLIARIIVLEVLSRQ